MAGALRRLFQIIYRRTLHNLFLVEIIINQRGGRFKALLSIFPKHIAIFICYCIRDSYINELYGLYELTHTNILNNDIINHIDKNQHNLNMKSLMLFEHCL